MTFSPLPQPFYARPADTVARDLLGKILIVDTGGPLKTSRIVETEAYLGPHDLACHASKGRTARTEVMFGAAGASYIYLIYGMYDMFNIVTGDVGDAQAVLIRAVEPIENVTGKTDGPGKLTRALGITRAHNALPLSVPPVFLAAGPKPLEVVTTTRVGIDYAGEWRDAPLRYYDSTSNYVSRR